MRRRPTSRHRSTSRSIPTSTSRVRERPTSSRTNCASTPIATRRWTRRSSRPGNWRLSTKRRSISASRRQLAPASKATTRSCSSAVVTTTTGCCPAQSRSSRWRPTSSSRRVAARSRYGRRSPDFSSIRATSWMGPSPARAAGSIASAMGSASRPSTSPIRRTSRHSPRLILRPGATYRSRTVFVTGTR